MKHPIRNNEPLEYTEPTKGLLYKCIEYKFILALGKRIMIISGTIDLRLWQLLHPDAMEENPTHMCLL